MAENAAAAVTAADVIAVTSPSCRTVDFSINGLLSSHRERSGVERATSLLDNDYITSASGQLSLQSSAALDSTALLRHRLAAAALWYPWLHSVTSLQSPAGKHRSIHG